jgi:hypothetical protein
MLTKGRPAKWTKYRSFRLWEFISYSRRDLKQSLRRACQLISEREPWRSTGLSPATLRRRYSEVTDADMRAMMGPFRYREAVQRLNSSGVGT